MQQYFYFVVSLLLLKSIRVRHPPLSVDVRIDPSACSPSLIIAKLIMLTLILKFLRHTVNPLNILNVLLSDSLRGLLSILEDRNVYVQSYRAGSGTCG